MHRRQVLTIAGATLLAGCSGDGGETDESTNNSGEPEPKRTETETPNNDPTPPEIIDVSLLTEWQSPGDFEEYSIERGTLSGGVIIGFKYRAYVHDGTMDVTEQMTIYSADDRRVGHEQSDQELILDRTGELGFEHAFGFDTRQWDGAGDYEARIRIRDDITNETSETYTYEFTVE